MKECRNGGKTFMFYLPMIILNSRNRYGNIISTCLSKYRLPSGFWMEALRIIFGSQKGDLFNIISGNHDLYQN